MEPDQIEGSRAYIFNNKQVPESVDEGVLKEAYQVIQCRQRPLPEGGYLFPKNDHVTIKVGCLPPLPCKVCGSKNHWDKECSDWAVYLEHQKKHVKLVTTSEEDQVDTLYHNAYLVLLHQCLVDLEPASGFEVASSIEVETPEGSPDELEGYKTTKTEALSGGDDKVITKGRTKQINGQGLQDLLDTMAPSSQTHQTTMETVEDEYWENQGRMPMATKHLLECDDNFIDNKDFIPHANMHATYRETYRSETQEHSAYEKEDIPVPVADIPPPASEHLIRFRP